MGVSSSDLPGVFTQGDDAIAIGTKACYSSFQGDNSISIGQLSGSYGRQEDAAIAIGNRAGAYTTQASGSLAIGSHASAWIDAGTSFTHGDGSIAVGYYSGFKCNQSNGAIALGGYAGYNGNQGANAIAIGYGAGSYDQKGNSIVLSALGGYGDDSLKGFTTPEYDGLTSVGGLFVKPIFQKEVVESDDGYLYYNQQSCELISVPRSPIARQRDFIDGVEGQIIKGQINKKMTVYGNIDVTNTDRNGNLLSDYLIVNNMTRITRTELVQSGLLYRPLGYDVVSKEICIMG
jgi:hypothetical protein